MVVGRYTDSASEDNSYVTALAAAFTHMRTVSAFSMQKTVNTMNI